MRFPRKRSVPKAEMDMTPMIDCAFQLISFFMFAISFSQNEQDERVMLPDSTLARPASQPTPSRPESSPEDPHAPIESGRRGRSEHYLRGRSKPGNEPPPPNAPKA